LTLVLRSFSALCQHYSSAFKSSVKLMTHFLYCNICMFFCLTFTTNDYCCGFSCLILHSSCVINALTMLVNITVQCSLTQNTMRIAMHKLCHKLRHISNLFLVLLDIHVFCLTIDHCCIFCLS